MATWHLYGGIQTSVGQALQALSHLPTFHLILKAGLVPVLVAVEVRLAGLTVSGQLSCVCLPLHGRDAGIADAYNGIQLWYWFWDETQVSQACMERALTH